MSLYDYDVPISDFVFIVNLVFLLASLAAFFSHFLLFWTQDEFQLYEPSPGTKWVWQENPELRSTLEPPPNELMKGELAVFQSGVGRWPSWFIGWDYENGTWDWAGGWRGDGVPPQSRREPLAEGLKWYWQVAAESRLPDEPPPTGEMDAEEKAYGQGQGPMPAWFLISQRQENPPLEPSIVWGQEWHRDERLDRSKWREPPPFLESAVDEYTAGKVLISFIGVYLLVMLADWIQGPYLYAIYKELKVPDDKILLLFGADTFSSIVTGSYSGIITDRLGRKNGCLMFCIAYIASTYATVLPSCCRSCTMPLLIGGRLFRGLATNLLYSAFDSWFITTYDYLRLRRRGYNIGRIFGLLTIVKAISALWARHIGEAIVTFTGYKQYNIVASVGLFTIAWASIAITWDENYGYPATTSVFSSFTTNKRFGALTIMSVIFNVSLDVFTLFWVRFLQDSVPTGPKTIPQGRIYSIFLYCSILGASIGNIFVATKRLLKYNNALAAATLVGAVSLGLAAVTGNHFQPSFLLLCIFRICAGLISPMIDQLKYELVPSSSRSQVYTLFHLPFFQWSHWIHWVLLYFFGPYPGDLSDQVFLVLAVFLAASGVYWFFVSNGLHILPAARLAAHGGPDSLPTMLDKARRLYRGVRYLLCYIYRALGSIWFKCFIHWPAMIGTLIAIYIASALSVIWHGVCWVPDKIKRLWRWAFRGGAFPDFELGNPPLTPSRLRDGDLPPPLLWLQAPEVAFIQAYLQAPDGTWSVPDRPVPPPDTAPPQAGDFQRFWEASEVLFSVLFLCAVIVATTFGILLAGAMALDKVLGTHFAVPMYMFASMARSWTSNHCDRLNLLIFKFYLDHSPKVPWALKYLKTSALNLFTTCTVMIISAFTWSIEWAASAVLLPFFWPLELFLRHQEFLESLLTRISGLLIPANSYLSDIGEGISDSIKHVSVSVKYKISEARHDSLYHLDSLFNSTVERLANSTEQLIPGGWHNPLFNYTSERIRDGIEAGMKIVLKEEHWKEIIKDHPMHVASVTIPAGLILYVIPWRRSIRSINVGVLWLFKKALHMGAFIFYLPEKIFFSTLGFPLKVLKLMFGTVYSTVARLLTWIISFLPADENPPGPLKMFVDPPRLLFRFTDRLLRKLIGKLLCFSGWLLERIGTFFARCSWVWDNVEKFGRALIHVGEVVNRGLKRFVCIVFARYMGLSDWLQRVGQDWIDSAQPPPPDSYPLPPSNTTSPSTSPTNSPLPTSPPGNNPPTSPLPPSTATAQGDPPLPPWTTTHKDAPKSPENSPLPPDFPSS